MEQLRGLTWGLQGSGGALIPVTDTTSNLATDPVGDDGLGLQPSPSTSLDESTAGYVDYLDAAGRWVGTGTTPPAGTAFVRRWSIQPLATNPNNTLVLQVRVLPLTRVIQSGGALSGMRISDETRLVSVTTRKAQ